MRRHSEMQCIERTAPYGAVRRRTVPYGAVSGVKEPLCVNKSQYDTWIRHIHFLQKLRNVIFAVICLPVDVSSHAEVSNLGDTLSSSTCQQTVASRNVTTTNKHILLDTEKIFSLYTIINACMKVYRLKILRRPRNTVIL